MTAEELKRKMCYDENGSFLGQESVIDFAKEYARQKCEQQRRIIASTQNPLLIGERTPEQQDSFNRVMSMRPPAFD